MFSYGKIQGRERYFPKKLPTNPGHSTHNTALIIFFKHSLWLLKTNKLTDINFHFQSS